MTLPDNESERFRDLLEGYLDGAMTNESDTDFVGLDVSPIMPINDEDDSHGLPNLFPE